MATTASYPRPELLQVADTVARDKGIDRDEVLQAMEQAIQKAGRSKYGHEYDIRAEIDRKNGEIKLMRFREVADPVENEATQIPLAEAKHLNPEAEIGDFLTDPLPPIDFGRIAAQTAKQVIVQRVRDAERQRQYKRIQGPRRRDRQRPRQARRIRQCRRRSRPRRGDPAPRRAAAARELPPGRARARLYLRRAPGSARAADLSVAHPSAIHGQAVRAGSAGDL